MPEPTLEIADHRATIWLQRPDKRNRIEPADLVRLIELCDQIDDDPSVRVVVLGSSGPSFCSGFHLGALADGEKLDVSFSDLCNRIERLRAPSIARVAGNIHGGGTDLAISTDFRIAADGIHLLMPAAKLAIQYYGSGLRRFVDRIGPTATKRIFLTALPFECDELLRLGYLDEVMAESALDSRIDELAAAVAALSPAAIVATKAAIDGLASGRRTEEDVEETHRELFKSDDHREAMAALREKRPPTFS